MRRSDYTLIELIGLGLALLAFVLLNPLLALISLGVGAYMWKQRGRLTILPLITIILSVITLAIVALLVVFVVSLWQELSSEENIQLLGVSFSRYSPCFELNVSESFEELNVSIYDPTGRLLTKETKSAILSPIEVCVDPEYVCRFSEGTYSVKLATKSNVTEANVVFEGAQPSIDVTGNLTFSTADGIYVGDLNVTVDNSGNDLPLLIGRIKIIFSEERLMLDDNTFHYVPPHEKEMYTYSSWKSWEEYNFITTPVAPSKIDKPHTIRVEVYDACGQKLTERSIQTMFVSEYKISKLPVTFTENGLRLEFNFQCSNKIVRDVSWSTFYESNYWVFTLPHDVQICTLLVKQTNTTSDRILDGEEPDTYLISSDGNVYEPVSWYTLEDWPNVQINKVESISHELQKYLCDTSPPIDIYPRQSVVWCVPFVIGKEKQPAIVVFGKRFLSLLGG